MCKFRSNLRKKQNYLILAIIAVAFLTLFGCGGGGGSSNNNNPPANTPPTANAGPDQTVDEGANVTLDGTASSDSDGSIASYAWIQLSGTVVAINNGDTATPSFTAPAVAVQEDLVFQLTVTDNEGATDTDDVTVTVNPVNAPPTADAGPDQTVDEGDDVTLDGSASSDSDGSIASYAWIQLSGTVVAINNGDTANPSFTAPAVAVSEDLVFRLTVTDNLGATDTDEVTVTVNNIVLLSVSQGFVPAEVDLTTQGSSDWAHWARLVTADINRKSGGGNQIGNYTEIGPNAGENRMQNDLAYSFSWSDGDPILTEPGVRRGLFFPFNVGQEDSGYSLTLTADRTPRILKLYLGAFDATGKLVASLDDGSATSPDLIITNPTGSSWLSRVVTIIFRAEAPTTMTVAYTLQDDHGTPSALSLVAATLAPGKVQPPVLSPNGGEFTDAVQVQIATVPNDAAIHYTLDGSDPDTSSTLYTGPFTINAVGATTTVKARAFRANYTESDIVTADFTLNANNGGSLSAFVEDPPVDGVSLTSVGTRDWAHWGRTNSTEINRKLTGGNQIGNYTAVGANDGINWIVRNLPYAFDWIGGNPTGVAANVRKGIFFVFGADDGSQVGNGYSLTLDADQTPRTLKLYLGAFDSTAILTASLDDNSASNAVVRVSNPAGDFDKVVTINFTAAGAATMTVTFTLEDDNGTPSALFLEAAALQ